MKLAVLVITTLATPALAQPAEIPPPTTPVANRGYLATSVVFGMFNDRVLEGVSLEGSKRLGGPLYAHAQVSATHADDLAIIGPALQGTYQDLRVGAESRACTRQRGACLYGGADVGVVRMSLQTDDDVMERATELHSVFVPRAGLEVGQVVRFRLGVEVPVAPGITGVTLNTGLGFAL